MGFGEIIKRSWKITWRYKALWVLGLFAGVTGGSAGGGGNYNFGSGSGRSGADRYTNGMPDLRELGSTLASSVLLIASVLIALLLISLVFAFLQVAARGGLVHAVNSAEEGVPFTLGAAWNEGFARFWSLLGLSLLLGLPVLVLSLAIGLAVVLPIMIPLLQGNSLSPGSFVPACGSLAIGVPLLIVLSVVLGIMHELALRHVMLGGMGAVQAAGEAWRGFRARIKDTLLMWLVNLGLNIVSGIVLAVPLVVVAVVLVVPAVLVGRAGSWGSLAALVGVGVVIIVVISMVYTAIWGTFTSALWTIFYRRFTGREALPEPVPAAPAAPAAPTPVAPAPTAPAQPTGPDSEAKPPAPPYADA